MRTKTSEQQGRAGAKSNAGASAASHLELGIAQFQAGRTADAEACFRQILEKFPTHPDALHLLGVVAIATQRHAAGVELIRQAIRHNRNNPDYYANLGAGYSALGQLQEALESFKSALNLKRNAPAVLKNRANVLVRLGRFAEAIADFEAAVSLKPDFAEAYNDLGHTLSQVSQLEAAAESFRKALKIVPCYAAALNNLRGVLVRLRRPEEALRLIDEAISISPGMPDLLNIKGVALKDLDRFDEALACFDRAIAINPRFAAAHTNRGTCLEGMARYGEALANYQSALSIDPDEPETHWNLAVNRLRLGDLLRGWIESEWRWKSPSLNLGDRRFDKPLWLGAEPIAGKVILLHNEQGLGDALQFCRYVPLLRDRGAEIILEIERPIKELLSRWPGISRCLARGDQLPTFDFHCPLTSLPLAFSTTLDTIPSEVPYLPQASEEAGPQLGPSKRPRIGLVWSGNPNHTNDRYRSLPFGKVLPLLDGVDAQFVSLQKNARAEDEELLRQRNDVLDLGPELRDFCATAAVVQQLDLIISVDTSVAHLAGGLGRPLWILLPYIPDWRWLLDRDDSPWYPTARLFRQTATRDWTEVVERVREALVDRIARPRIS
jgi:tetratricopeptide (TPR) repeat protein